MLHELHEIHLERDSFTYFEPLWNKNFKYITFFQCKTDIRNNLFLIICIFPVIQIYWGITILFFTVFQHGSQAYWTHTEACSVCFVLWTVFKNGICILIGLRFNYFSFWMSPYPLSYTLVAFEYGNILATVFVWDMRTLWDHLNSPWAGAMNRTTLLSHCVQNTWAPVTPVRCPRGEWHVCLCFCES